MGVGRTFSREAIKIFPGGQKWWNFILPIQNHENDLLAKNLQGKCQISNSRGFPPLPTPMLPCTNKPAKTEIWNHVTANSQLPDPNENSAMHSALKATIAGEKSRVHWWCWKRPIGAQKIKLNLAHKLPSV